MIDYDPIGCIAQLADFAQKAIQAQQGRLEF